MSELRTCWENPGEELRRQMSEDIAKVVEVVYEQGQAFDPSRAEDADYTRLEVDSYQTLVAKFNAAWRNDYLVGIDEAGVTRFLPQPLLSPLPKSPEP